MLVAIGGGVGSGKTTVARLAAEALGSLAVHVDMDHYYTDRTAAGCELNEALLVAHLKALREGGTVLRPTYDWRQGKCVGQTVITAASVLLVEGVWALSLEVLRPWIDLAVWVEAASYTRLARVLTRDYRPEAPLGDFLRELVDDWWPDHDREVAPSQRYAALILDNEHHAPAMPAQILADTIRGRLARLQEVTP